MRKNNFLGWNFIVKVEEKNRKNTNLKANFWVVKMNNSAKVIPIYKAKTFICSCFNFVSNCIFGSGTLGRMTQKVE
jgi:hypothetical protein